MNNSLYTIGHSNHTIEHFIALLERHAITAICDVRSQPYSRYAPQFNRETLRAALKARNIHYVFMGKELGGRGEAPADSVQDKTQYYGYLAGQPSFQVGIDRLKQGMARYSIALMCAEADPITCHRMILVCRHLRAIAAQICHILSEGNIETNAEAETRLMQLRNIEPDMWTDREQCIDLAYKAQGQRIAYAGQQSIEGE